MNVKNVSEKIPFQHDVFFHAFQDNDGALPIGYH